MRASTTDISSLPGYARKCGQENGPGVWTRTFFISTTALNYLDHQLGTTARAMAFSFISFTTHPDSLLMEMMSKGRVLPCNGTNAFETYNDLHILVSLKSLTRTLPSALEKADPECFNTANQNEHVRFVGSPKLIQWLQTPHVSSV
jgi:hypothetical protein